MKAGSPRARSSAARKIGTLTRFEGWSSSAFRSNLSPVATKKTGTKKPKPIDSSFVRKSGWVIRWSWSTSVSTAPAGFIITAVFGPFAIGNERALAMMGVGFGAAIFIDAFIIRLLLLPAVMHLAGPAMWWMPAWLDKGPPPLNIDRPDDAGEPPAAGGRIPEPQPASS